MSRSLSDAVRAGNLAEVEIRINMGEDVDQVDPPLYKSPLHWAVDGGHLKIAELLVNRGARVDMADCLGETALALAKREKKAPLIEVLSKAAKIAVQKPPSPCPSPIPDIMADPLFRDPPPWKVPDIRQSLEVPGEDVSQGHANNKAKTLVPNLFKSKKKDIDEREEVKPGSHTKSYIANIMKPTHKEYSQTDSKGTTAKTYIAKIMKPTQKEYSETESPCGVTESVKTAKSYMVDMIKVTPKVTESERPKSTTSLSESFRATNSSGNTYMSQIMPSMSKETVVSEGEKRPTSQISFTESFKNMVTPREKAELHENQGPTSQISVEELTVNKISLSPTEKPSSNDNTRPKSQISMSESFKAKGSNALNFMSNVIPSRSKEKTEVESQNDARPTSQISMTESFKNKMSFTKSDKSDLDEDIRPKSQISITESFKTKGSNALSFMTNKIPSMSKEKVEPEEDKKPKSQTSVDEPTNIRDDVPTTVENETPEEKKPSNIDTMKEKGSEVKSYMSNLIKKKERGNSNTKNESKPNHVQNFITKIQKSKEKKSDMKQHEKGTKCITDSIKSKGSTIKGYIPNKFQSKNVAKPKDKESSQKSSSLNLKSFKKTGDDVKSYISTKFKTSTKEKLKPSPKAKTTSKIPSWKRKGSSEKPCSPSWKTKKYISGVFDRKKTPDATKKKNTKASSSPIVESFWPKVLASKTDTSDKHVSKKWEKRTRETTNTFSFANFMSNSSAERGEEFVGDVSGDSILGSSVKDYVKMYEQKNLAAGEINKIPECHSRPFKEFTTTSVSTTSGAVKDKEDFVG